MARITKAGLSYYNTDTDRYQDIKIKRLKHAFGGNGIAVFDYVLCEIYRVRGCFMEWDESTAFDVAEYFGLKESLVREIIHYCCHVGLFNKELLASGRVLTSRSIQERYEKICRDAKRVNFNIPKEIDLTQEVMAKTPELIAKTQEEVHKEKKRKEKESKEEEENAREKKSPPPEAEKISDSFFSLNAENEEKKLREKKKWPPLSSGAPPPLSEAEQLDALVMKVSQMKGLNIWLEQCAMKFKLPKEEITKKLDEFTNHAFTKDKHNQPLKELKDYFINWLSNKQLRAKSTNNGVKSKSEVRNEAYEAEQRKLLQELGHFTDSTE